MEKILEFLSSCGMFYLATVDGNQPKLRPMNFAKNVNGKLSFYTSKQKDLYKQLQKNPLAEISATSKTGWIRISGHISFNDSPEVFEKWSAESAFFRFAEEDKVICCFDSMKIEYTPGFQAPLPEFVAGWKKIIAAESEVRYMADLI
jgi:general stress protein 26